MNKLLASVVLLGLFLLMIPSANALSLIYHDSLVKDVFDPYTVYYDPTGALSISAINGYATYRAVSADAGMRLNISRTSDFDYSVQVNESFGSFFSSIYPMLNFGFNDTLGNLTFGYFQRTGGGYIIGIRFNYASQNSTALSWDGSWIQFNMSRRGSLVELKAINITDGSQLAYVRYNFPASYDVNSTVILGQSSCTAGGFCGTDGYYGLVNFKEVYIYGTVVIVLPSKTYHWIHGTGCMGDNVTAGSSIGCIPDSFVVPSDCKNIISYCIGFLVTNPPTAYCSNTSVEYMPISSLLVYNPINSSYQENVTQSWDHCGHYDLTKYYNYSAGTVAQGVVTGHEAGSCPCIDNFTVSGIMQVECDRPVNTTILPNGTEIYCDPSLTAQCEDNSVVYYDYNCTKHTVYCNITTQQCVAATCVPLSAGIPTNYTTPLVNQTELEAEGMGWLLPFTTPFFVATIIMLITAAFFAYLAGKENAAPVFMIVVIIFVIIYALPNVGIYPIWFGFVIVVFAALLLTRTLKGMFTGGG